MNTLCTLVRERLPALVEDDLPRGEAELVNAHLATCATCAVERDRAGAFVAAVRDANRDDAAFAAARVRLSASIDAESRPRAVRRLASVPLAVRVAAVLAICAGSLAWARPPVVALDAVARATGDFFGSVRLSTFDLDHLTDAASRGSGR